MVKEVGLATQPNPVQKLLLQKLKQENKTSIVQGMMSLGMVTDGSQTQSGAGHLENWFPQT